MARTRATYGCAATGRSPPSWRKLDLPNAGRHEPAQVSRRRRDNIRSPAVPAPCAGPRPYGRAQPQDPLMSSRSPLWRERDFLRLWAAQTVSDFGARITREGLPIMAVITLAAAPSQLGVLAALGSAAMLVVGLTAGD